MKPRSLTTTHGMTKTPTYASWAAMLNRCRHPEDNAYGTYDGVHVCERWFKFENFLEDMGLRPDGMSLDRFPDRQGGYSPDNCRWATAQEQALNRKTTRWFEWEGTTYSLSGLAEHAGLKRLTLAMRLKRGWTLGRAMTTPDDGASRQKLYEIGGEFLTINMISEKYGVNKGTIRTRLKLGKTMDEAVAQTGKEYVFTNRLRRLEVGGTLVDIPTAARMTGVQAATLYSRLSTGWPIDRIFETPVLGTNNRDSPAVSNAGSNNINIINNINNIINNTINLE